MIKEEATENRYIPLVRPMGFGGLPKDVKWDFVEAPWDLAHIRRDIPYSSHRYGVIRTNRPLSEQELDHFGLTRV